MANIREMHFLGLSCSPGFDVVELCGGEGQTTIVARRRKLATGANFDIVTGTDLTDPIVQEEVIHYLRKWAVLVVVMAPVCGPFGSWGNFNYTMNRAS